MKRRIILSVALCALVAGAAALATARGVILPSGWLLYAPQSAVAATGTMPQGIALSPDETRLAVIESGVGPAALRILDVPSLKLERVIKLKGAFGKPVWADKTTVLVPGANVDAVLAVNANDGTIAHTYAAGKGTWPVAVAMGQDGAIAEANDGNATVMTIGTDGQTQSFDVGGHPSDLAYSADFTKLYVACRGDSTIRVIRIASGADTRVAAGKHPSALALSPDGGTLYVANGDDDSISKFDTSTLRLSGTIGLHPILRARSIDVMKGVKYEPPSNFGALPNSLLVRGGKLYVTLGGANAVATIDDAGRIVATAPTGWYPTGAAVSNDGTIYVSDGKGEGSPANPLYDPPHRLHTDQYVAAITIGSVRAIAHSETTGVVSLITTVPGIQPRADASILRANGPIKHVIYVIKENRSYDQVLGDIPHANGDPKLVWFGRDVTPNQHAIADRFGVFDNAFANAQVSADGHNWTDAAIANDYVERFWPPNYGGRRDLYDYQNGGGPNVPHNGYLWDAAQRAHITYRDYGENINEPDKGQTPGETDHPNLQGHFDPNYVGWDLAYSDLNREAEWAKEFAGFEADGKLPALEIVYLPNDHTSGARAGSPTPQAYVATNDVAVGRIVSAVSHSKYWESTAIFILEDDAQNGPDHVSAQRSTFYIASPYARGGVQHAHYSTASFVRTIGLLLGLQPLTLYDTTALPLYDAFGTTADLRAYDVLDPKTDLKGLNSKVAYGAAASGRMNWKDPDAVDADVLNDILAHAVGAR